MCVCVCVCVCVRTCSKTSVCMRLLQNCVGKKKARLSNFQYNTHRVVHCLWAIQIQSGNCDTPAPHPSARSSVEPAATPPSAGALRYPCGGALTSASVGCAGGPGVGWRPATAAATAPTDGGLGLEPPMDDFGQQHPLPFVHAPMLTSALASHSTPPQCELAQHNEKHASKEVAGSALSMSLPGKSVLLTCGRSEIEQMIIITMLTDERVTWRNAREEDAL